MDHRDGQIHKGDSFGQSGWESGYPQRPPKVSFIAPFVLLFCVGVVLTVLALILAGRV